MDPITSAIVGAVGKLAEPAVKDAYNAVKGLIVRNFERHHPDFPRALDELERRPESNGRKEMVAEEVRNARAADDPELCRAANALILLLRKETATSMQSVHQNISGDRNITSGIGNITLESDVKSQD